MRSTVQAELHREDRILVSVTVALLRGLDEQLSASQLLGGSQLRAQDWIAEDTCTVSAHCELPS